MKIVGILSWYDESPGWLAACVYGLGRFCDEIVAVDGAYMLYPNARERSHPDQAEAITLAAETAGVGLTLHRPGSLFAGNEVEKRNTCLRIAGHGLGLTEDDWLVVFDADLHILRVQPESIRWDLGHTDALVATYCWLDGEDYLSSERMAQIAAEMDISTEWTGRVRCIYRWHETLQYGPTHWSVSREDELGERVYLGGPHELATPCVDLDRALVVYHRSRNRAMLRRQAQDTYYATRDMMKVEGQIDNGGRWMPAEAEEVESV